MEQITSDYTLDLAGGFPLSTDSMVLSDFVKLPKNARVLDLGSGCAVTGIELSETAHAAALRNIARNGLDHRLSSICADLRTMPFEPGAFDLCVSNPPYFSGGARHSRNPDARQEDTCPPKALFAAAAKALRWGGDFFLVHKPERLAELCFEGTCAGLEPKRLRLVRHRPGAPISLILLSCRKGGKPGLQIDELSLYNTDGTPTEDHRRIYHI